MKKVFSLSLLALFLMFFMLISVGEVGVSAYTYNPNKAGTDFTPYKNDIVFVSVLEDEDWDLDYWNGGDIENPIRRWDNNIIYVYIKEIRHIGYFQFDLRTDFSPEIEDEIREVSSGDYLGSFILTEYGLDGMYWNPWLEIWQLDYPVGTADDWINHISQYDYSELGYGLARSEVYFLYNYEFGLKIKEEPFHEREGLKIKYAYGSSEDWEYFEPELGSSLENWYSEGKNILGYLEAYYSQDFDGYLYWNFEEEYWQIEQYGTSELDYYKQRVDDLEDEISSLEDEISSLEDEISSLEDEISSLEDEISSLEDEISSLEDEISSLEDEISSLEDEISSLEDEISSLEDEISSLEDEISSLEDEISSLEDEISSLEDEISSLEDEISSLEDEISLLEDEISSLEDEISLLEDALDLEYDRGYNDGYEIGYSEGLLVENNDIAIIKWFVPLVVIIIIVGIIEPIIILKRRG